MVGGLTYSQGLNDVGKKRSETSGNGETGRTEQPPRKRRMPVVAIGASAGGLDALKELLANMPADTGASFVVVTHQSPGRTSVLAELLAKVTDMPVVDAEEGIVLEPDRVVVAKDGVTDVVGGTLHLVRGDHRETTTHPIDHFFRSLAADQREHAICVVLSGAGNDGTLGVKSIAAAGGLTMVQDPETAGYGSMPAAARATGLADFVLPPAQMGGALADFVRGPYLRRSREGKVPLLPDEDVRAILLRLRRHTGHDFTGYKPSTVSRRILRRMGVHRIEEPGEYLRFLRDTPRELDMLFRELLISVTSFFRDPEAFAALAEKALPELIRARDDDETLRVWVAGCASGEEAYSIAILLDESLRGMDRTGEFQVFATDLDERAIHTARIGLYPEGIAADVSGGRLERYFTREDSSYRICKRIRERMVFAAQNVIGDPPFTRIDLIVCRNVLIYLEAEVQERLLPVFHYALRPGGILFLGSAETAGKTDDLFEPVDDRSRVLRRRDVGSTINDVLLMPRRLNRRAEASRGGQQPAGRGRPATEVQRLLLETRVPPTALVDERGNVVYLHGRTGRYLEPEEGEPRYNVVEMARPGLRKVLSPLLHRAKNGEPAEKRGVRVQTNGNDALVDVSVTPVTRPESLRGLYLVSFSPSPERAEAAVPVEPRTRPPEEREARLEEELAHTRESLQSTVEELETSNEELQSSNEELQSSNEELVSTNEELETSREELQSLNEELNTVNAELQSKVDALARSNDDMHNLLNTMQVATLFLDEELRVQRFTERARSMVRLIESDVGRPLSDLSTHLDYERFSEDCRRVLTTLEPREIEARGNNGRWYLLRIMPYRTAENVIEGVVVSMLDIDRLKRAELAAVASKKFFESVVNTVSNPMLVLDGHLKVVSANDGFYRTFQVFPRATEGRPVYELGDGQWDLPGLRRLLEEILPTDSVVTDYRIDSELPGVGRRTFLLNARRMERGADEDEALILLAFADVTGDVDDGP